jgi:site-specific recombinase XerD
MNHDDALLREQIVRVSRVDERGPIPEFLAKKDAEQAKQTCAGYRYALKRFLAFVGEDATVGDVTEATGHRFLRHLREENLSDNTIATYLRSLKAFTRWMHKKGWTERDRFADVKQPPFVRPKFDTLASTEKQAILTSLNPDTFLGARNLAILCLFLDTGVRREELVHLKEARVHLGEGYIEVYSQKTSDWRVIPLSSEAVAICQNYLKWRDRFMTRPIRRRADKADSNHRVKEARNRTSDTFFCTWLGGRLSVNSVGWMVRRLSAKLVEAGVNVRLHPHLFRHNFLTEKALDGENPSMVRRWAGHRKYEMTDYYFGLAEAKLAAIKPKQSTLAGLQILPKNRRPKQSLKADWEEAAQKQLTPIIERAGHSRPPAAARPGTPAATASPVRGGSPRRDSGGDARSSRRSAD